MVKSGLTNLIYMSILTNWIVKYRSQIPYVNRRINRILIILYIKTFEISSKNSQKIIEQRTPTNGVIFWLKEILVRYLR